MTIHNNRVIGPPEAWERLAKQANERRAALGLRHLDIVERANAAGRPVSMGVLSLLMNARQAVCVDRSLLALDVGLGWPLGTSRAIVEGQGFVERLIPVGDLADDALVLTSNGDPFPIPIWTRLGDLPPVPPSLVLMVRVPPAAATPKDGKG